ncbi:uncharacterized [Tachysurus ichikawai]
MAEPGEPKRIKTPFCRENGSWDGTGDFQIETEENGRTEVKEETGFIPGVVGAIFVFHTRLEQMGSSVGGVKDSLLADTAAFPHTLA